MNQIPFTFFINTEQGNFCQNGGNWTHAFKYQCYDCLINICRQKLWQKQPLLTLKFVEKQKPRTNEYACLKQNNINT